ncbi:MAG: exo-alpha-sialidase [Actinobacteria bacterium]|nr:MAG: exo-alpha-sialidase [Actinomycetota bacterium]
MVRRTALLLFSTALFVLSMAPPAAAFNPDTRVSVGSPPSPFSENKQNEPAVAIDANQPNILAAGANDNIDLEACNAGNDTTCPFTPGVGTSGVYFSFDSGTTWTQPTYTGLSARGCQGVVGNTDPPCTPTVGPIGTVPNYYEQGLASNGDPALAFGPQPDANGGFSWTNGERLYYANLAANLSGGGPESFRGFIGIGVSSTDNVAAAAAGTQSAWTSPKIISQQSSATFSDKEQIWADNASSSPFFGTVYVCWAAFMGQELSPNALPAGLKVAVSHDGGISWKQHPIGSAANNRQKNPVDGCTIRTDSQGTAYIFGIGTKSQGGHQPFELMSKSTNGGTSWSNPVAVAGPVSQPGVFDPAQGRPTIDSVAGARSDLAPGPSVDIANGAPTGTDATDRIVMTYVSGALAQPHVYFTESTDHGATWSAPRAIESAGDRGYYAAPAISPNGTDVYVVYNAFTTPYHPTTADPNMLVGVVKHADTGGSLPTGAFTTLNRGVAGDARGSSANALSAEFLGDYVYAAATRTYGAAVWNDARNAADCSAIDAWRESNITGGTVARPAPQQDCQPTFGNSDIFGGTYADPTP